MRRRAAPRRASRCVGISGFPGHITPHRRIQGEQVQGFTGAENAARAPRTSARAALRLARPLLPCRNASSATLKYSHLSSSQFYLSSFPCLAITVVGTGYWVLGTGYWVVGTALQPGTAHPPRICASVGAGGDAPLTGGTPDPCERRTDEATVGCATRCCAREFVRWRT